MGLQGKVAIVTGSGRAIGRGIALRPAEDRAKIVVADVMGENARKAAKAIQALGVQSMAVVTDVTKSVQVYNLVEKAVAQFGKIDIMAANAGIADIKPALEISDEDWDHIFAVNTKGVFHCDQAAAKQMIKQGEGGIVMSQRRRDMRIRE